MLLPRLKCNTAPARRYHAVYHPDMQIMLVSMDSLARVSSALLTPTIGAIAVYIAYQQWNTNRRQARLALYDKRMVVFNNTVKLLTIIGRDAHVEFAELRAFLYETREHEFLFGKDIARYIGELWEKGTKLHAYHTAGKELDRQTELLDWFGQQFAVARQRFRKYMSFPKP